MNVIIKSIDSISMGAENARRGVYSACIDMMCGYVLYVEEVCAVFVPEELMRKIGKFVDSNDLVG